jgi:toxin YoeB
MNLTFTREAWDHYIYWQDHDRAIIRKVGKLIEECLRHPFDGTGKPEPLKGDFAGYWSRRIDREHRLVYRVSDTALEIVLCRFHYES